MRKENTNYSLWQRIGAMAMAVALVLGMVPTTGFAATGDIGTVSKVEDPETLTRPQEIYGDNTMNAGKVTVGKSVSKDAITVDGVNIGLTGANNFLVTISQSAQVMGLAHEISVPVDVVFVIDTSGSMDDNDRAETLVTAANSAIKTLMATNEENRVAVVAFSSEGYGDGTSGDAAANVLSSLAHYTGDAAENHLQWVNSEGSASGDERVYIAGRDMATITVTTGRGPNRQEETRNVYAFRHGKNGGTNIQAGIVAGAKLLTAVSDTTYTDPESGESVTRIPFVIVISDGQPTYTYDDETWYDPTVTGNNAADQQGPGSGAYEGNGFIAAMTAAYYKGVITEHYYGSKANASNHCYVYTMGVEIEALDDTTGRNGQVNSIVGDNQSLAQITLDPATYAADGQAYYTYGNSWDDNNQSTNNGWKTYWNSYVAGTEFNVRVNSNDTYAFTADSIAASKTYVNGIGYTGGLTYNDEYFAADKVEDMETIFEALISTILEKAIAVPTKVTTGDHDFDGYVTFTDPLGEYMELKDMKGIIADGYFYQGASAAQYLASGTNAEFNASIRNVIKTRMGLSDSDSRFASEAELNAFIESLLDTADGNSITWWGSEYHTGEEDTQVQVLAPAADDTIDYIEAQKAAGTVPADADYVCRSYFFYGEAGGTNPNPEHDYLYFVVRVQRSLSAPYQQTVVISAPASLLSVEKVMITEQHDDQGNLVYTASVTPSAPARVVYEVGLWDTINQETVSAIVSESYANEQVNGQGQVNYDPNTDTYYFFTNDWDRSESVNSHHRAMAKATFDAASDNGFYTYQQNTLIVDANGDPVTGNPAGTTAYYVREYYDWSGATAAQDGTYTATKKTVLVQVDIPADTELVQEDGCWYIPKGAYTAATLIVNGDDTTKTVNATDTSSIVAHPHRTGDSSNSHYTVLLGNNGVISLVSNPPEPTKSVENITRGITDADGKVVTVGDELEYTITAVNYGTEAGTITITDTVPAGTVFLSADGGVTPVDGTLTWVVENVAAGAEVTVSFRVRVTEEALDNNVVVSAITNTATAQLNNSPAYETNTTSNPSEGKQVVNQDGTTGAVQVGDVLQYSIEFHNDTGAVADVITVVDTLPAGTVFLSADHGGVYNPGDHTITWTFTNVQPGMGGVVTFTVQVDASAKTPIENGATITVGDNDPRQTNTTSTALDKGSLTLSKVLAAGDAAAEAFTLTLTDATGKLDGTYAVTGSSLVSSVTFVNGVAAIEILAGETVTIEELPSGVALTVVETPVDGWTPTYSSGTVTIPVDDAAKVTVTNDYYAEPVSFQLHAKKIFSGSNFPAGTFTFLASQCDAAGNLIPDGIVVTAVATASGEGSVIFSFSQRVFAEEMDRYYLITEASTTIPGVTTGAESYILHLVVEDNGAGKMVLTATVSSDGGQTWTALDNDSADNVLSVSFVNTYEPQATSVTIGGTKVLTGRYLAEGEFGFQLVDPVSGEVIATATNTEGSPYTGTFTFPAITYTAADMGGALEKTFTYYIREVNGGAANTTYDRTYYEVTVTVRDVNGKLEATQVITRYTYNESTQSYDASGIQAENIVFGNTYHIQDVSVTLTGTKTLTGEAADGLAQGEYAFTVYRANADGTLLDTDKDGAIDDEQPVSVGANNVGDSSASVSFAPIGFTAQDMTDAVLSGSVYTKDFYFLVTEDLPAALTKDPNMYYDQSAYLAKVTVTYDPSTGLLAVAGTEYLLWNGESWTAVSGMDFVNIQNPAEVKVTPVASKTTQNAPDGVSFSFSVLSTADGAEAAAGVGQANGSVAFSSMSFKTPGTYTYWIVESNAGNTTNGITYDASRYLMEVVVTRDSTNKLHASVSYYAAPAEKDGSTDVADYTLPVSAPAFENSYAANGYINLLASKSLTGRTLEIGEFAFKLVRMDNNGEIDGVVTGIDSNGDGIVTFATMYYSLADIPEGETSALIHYVMTEVNSGLPGVTYDTKAVDVYVLITNDGEGNITAVLADASGNPLSTDDPSTPAVETGIVFHNDYNPTGTQVTIRADKTLTGRELVSGEFGFGLFRYDPESQVWHAVGTAFNSANGSVEFVRQYNGDTLSTMAFDADGTYTALYRIDEINGNLGGITYSGAGYYVQVKIVHENGAYTVAAGYPKYFADEGCTQEVSLASFVNRYDTNDVQFTPVAHKLLLGANNGELDPAGFSFQVVETDAQGNPLTVVSGSQTINKVVSTGTSDASGKVSFSAIHYADETGCSGTDCADEGCAGTVHSHYYRIEEPVGSAEGVTYSTQVYYVRVDIHDNGKGLLEITGVTYFSDAFVTEITEDAVVITNHYGPGFMNLELELDKKFQTESGIPYQYTLYGSEFDFQVFADEACTQLVTVGTNGASVDGVASITFGTVVLTETGDYTFYIKELPRSGAPHIGIDTRVIKVTFTVTDDGYGNLSASTPVYTDLATGESLSAFSNVYKPEGTEVSLEVNKHLSGKELTDENFAFVLSDGTNAIGTWTKLSNGQYSVRWDYDAYDMSGADFANGVYTKTFTYSLYEKTGTAVNANGEYSYDETVYTVTVVLTDDGSGSIKASVTVTDAQGSPVSFVAFENSYDPTDVSLSLTDAVDATKTVVDDEGNVLIRDDVVFTFVVTDLNGQEIARGQTSGQTNADGTRQIVFTPDTLTYDAPGEYRYLITEVAETRQGYVLDTTVWCVHVMVHYDAATGALSVSLTDVYKHLLSEGHGEDGVSAQNSRDVAFVNTYDAQDVHLKLTLDKVLTGMALKENAFAFQLLNSDGTIAAEARNQADGTVTFYLDYDLQDLNGAVSRTFQYKVKEVIPSGATDNGDGTYTLNGITYDTAVYTVTVVLADDGKGNLTATVYGNVVTGSGTVDTGITFENVYHAEEVTVEFHALKRMEGMPLTDNAYSFQLQDEDGNVVAQGSNRADGTIVFQPATLTYTKPGTYVYTMVETMGDRPGVTFDDTSYTVTVVVTDNGKGNLEAKVTYTTAEGTYDQPVFVNIYTPDDINAQISAKKVMDGRDLAAEEFSFELLDEEGNRIELVKNAADGSVAFTEINYTKTGTYTYTIREIVPDEAVDNGDGTYTLNGVTYATAVYTVVVEVTDPEFSGALSQTVTYYLNGVEVAAGDVVFTNSYTTEDSNKIEIDGTKVLDGKDLEEGKYSFQLKAEDGTVIETVTNEADGSFAFTALTYSFADLGGETQKVFTYTVVEVKGSLGGVTYDETVYTVEVTVTDNGDGTLTAVAVITGGKNDGEIVFTNSYTTEDSNKIEIDGTKVLDGKDLEEGKYSFQLKAEDGTVIETVTNEADGSFAFTALTYSFADLGGETQKVFTYTVVEVKGSLGGVTYDETVYTVEVTVTDNGDGTLTAVAVITGGKNDGEIVFTNSYTTETTYVDVTATKEITGKDLEGDDYTFVLVNRADPNDTYSVKNAADGTILFQDLPFSKAGTYVYDLYELAGGDERTTYDETVYTVTVIVTDNGDGTLSAVVEYSETPVFHNAYTPVPVDVVIEGTKDLTGRDLQEGEFDFEVRDAEGNLITSGSNLADGTIVFDSFQVFEATEMTLYVTEVKGDDSSVVYDEYTYRVKLVVVNNNGVLSAELTYLDGAVIFYNVYEPPFNPETGDSTPVYLYAGLMAFSALALAVLTVCGPRKKERKFF